MLSELIASDFIDKTAINIATMMAKRQSLPDQELRNERRWMIFVAKADGYERLMRRKLRTLFSEQMAEVLTRMPSKASGDDWLFNDVKWVARFEEYGQLLLPQIIEDNGKAEIAHLDVAVSFDVSNPAVIDFVDQHSYKFSFKVNETTQNRLKAAFTEGMREGESIPKLRRRVQDVFDMRKYDATRIARTEVIRASNAGTEFAFQQSGVVEAKEWLTAIDERTCPYCEDMNGKQMGLGESYFAQGDTLTVGQQSLSLNYEDIQRPPLHPHCRCTLNPVLIS